MIAFRIVAAALFVATTVTAFDFDKDFRTADKNEDDALDTEEVGDALMGIRTILEILHLHDVLSTLNAFGVTREDIVKKIMTDFDWNKDQKIDKKEGESLMKAIKYGMNVDLKDVKDLTETEIHTSFKKADRNGDEKIEENELLLYLDAYVKLVHGLSYNKTTHGESPQHLMDMLFKTYDLNNDFSYEKFKTIYTMLRPYTLVQARLLKEDFKNEMVQVVKVVEQVIDSSSADVQLKK